MTRSAQHDEDSGRQLVPRWVRSVGIPGRGGEGRQDEAHSDAAKRTARVLAGLPGEEWALVADFAPRSAPRADVLIGRGGVYYMLSRNPPGAVRVKDGTLWLRRGSDARAAERPSTELGRKLVDPARALEREIRARTGLGPRVHPVVVLWSEFPQGLVQALDVTFVQGRELGPWLRHAAPQLDAHAGGAITQVVRNMAAEAGRRGNARAPRPAA